ncbi:hypothetical protein RSWS8N_12790 [Cereibacter sphaeroides WS8N]|uniref:hypothetical protein n=1 Tax=Cereibacter sphaeroides TaxID=1063 RepID=UPI00020DF48A|nr:hypothetical protein [Cereibacter sphaeroides]EGJ22966.1 hypothetical protein RSWS8N_12790 [Cereibacter sphaeroides WS8N]
MTFPRLGLALAAVLATTAAFAQEGGSQTGEQKAQVTGELQSISMAPPPQLELLAPDGARWIIDLGEPERMERAGLDAEAAQPGVAVHVLGIRAADGANRMEALRITIDGTAYDLRPEEVEPKT